MHIDANIARTRACGIALTLMAASFIAACGSDSGPTNSGPPPVPFTGVYDLHSISDSLLPFRVLHPTLHPWIIDSGHVKLNSDMSYAYNADGLFLDSTFASATDTGTFTESGSTITFTSQFLEGQTFSATATDSSLTVNLLGDLIADGDHTLPVVFLKEP
jgi:hypothetical protein